MHAQRQIPPATGHSSSREAKTFLHQTADERVRFLAAVAAACKETLIRSVHRWEAREGSYPAVALMTPAGWLVGLSIQRLLT